MLKRKDYSTTLHELKKVSIISSVFRSYDTLYTALFVGENISAAT